jgi:putative transposase/transposase-like zinc-binding protein
MPFAPPTYRPRDTEHTVLHVVIREYLETFLRETTERGEGSGLPQFVDQEFRKFLTCGVLEHGFARLRCDGCGLDHLLPFSCKGRGFCPSCGGRRMTERAAHAVDAVLPPVPVRQWVLSLPHWLRYVLAWDHGLCRAVLAVHVQALLGFQRRRTRRLGVRDGRSGSLTVIQRFGGALNLNIHFHTLVLDGVFTTAAHDAVQFHPLPPPTDAEVARLVTAIRARILRLLGRRGLGPDADVSRPDPVAEDSPTLAGLSSASVRGRVALGPRAGARLMALGRDPEAQWVSSGGPRHAHLDGFDLHANGAVDGQDRERFEQLCRYLLRPAVAQDRLRFTEDGRVVLELKSAWADGTSHLVFDPLDLLARLAALVPRPRVNLILYHGVLAPNARSRAAVVSYGAASAVEPPPEAAVSTATDAPSASDAASLPPRRGWTWAQLMQRAFDVDVLICRACGGRLQLIATILDPATIRAILRSMGVATEAAADRAPPGARRG